MKYVQPPVGGPTRIKFPNVVIYIIKTFPDFRKQLVYRFFTPLWNERIGNDRNNSGLRFQSIFYGLER